MENEKWKMTNGKSGLVDQVGVRLPSSGQAGMPVLLTWRKNQ
jgi:hypothetical protein